MSEETKKPRLFKRFDGVWLKSVSGKPIPATEQEIALWESAQIEVLDAVKGPKTLLEQLGEYSKFGGGGPRYYYFLSLGL